jgi:hypothetical protein
VITLADIAAELVDASAELTVKWEGQWVAKVACPVLPRPLTAMTPHLDLAIETVMRMLRSHLLERARRIPKERLS